MKGDNELCVNAATLIEALQEYFDKRSVRPGGLTVARVSYRSVDGRFSVLVGEPEYTEAQKK